MIINDLKKKQNLKINLKNIKIIDYKNILILKNFINENHKIIPSRITGIKSKIQKKITKAIKYARYIAILPYIDN